MMLFTSAFHSHITSVLGEKIRAVKSLSGHGHQPGNRPASLLIYTDQDIYFIKVRNHADGDHWFAHEQEGLKSLGQFNILHIPGKVHASVFDGIEYILMQYVHPGKADTKSWVQLGSQLAHHHAASARSLFGWPRTNFIGLMNQANGEYESWPDFFLEKRILPQLMLAVEKQYFDHHMPDRVEKHRNKIHDILGTPQASLLHGDLWRGNVLFDESGQAVVIDPAVYYGDGEVDLAMARLFGGFDDAFFDAYHAVRQPAHYYSEKRDLYQLYYILVHLNIFGPAYRSQAAVVLKTYFSD